MKACSLSFPPCKQHCRVSCSESKPPKAFFFTYLRVFNNPRHGRITLYMKLNDLQPRKDNFICSFYVCLKLGIKSAQPTIVGARRTARQHMCCHLLNAPNQICKSNVKIVLLASAKCSPHSLEGNLFCTPLSF